MDLFYHDVNREGETLDFMLSKRCDSGAARKFFNRVVGTNSVLNRIVTDMSDANLAGLQRPDIIP